MHQVIWIARHGNRQDFVDPEWPRTAARPFDPGLSPDGILQAQRLGRRLAGEGMTHIFASPFLRTVETAHQVAEVLDLPIHLETGICEWLNPAWFPSMPEMLPPEALAAQFPRIDPGYTPQLRPVYPETLERALARAGATARQLARAYPGPILLVGHEVSVRGAAMGFLEGLEELACALCSLTKLVCRDRAWIMELCADVTHLDEAEAAHRFH